MLKKDALAHFGNNHTRVAEAIKITRSAVSQWGDQVPLLAALKLEKATGGKLRVDLKQYMRQHKEAA